MVPHQVRREPGKALAQMGRAALQAVDTEAQVGEALVVSHREELTSEGQLVGLFTRRILHKTVCLGESVHHVLGPGGHADFAERVLFHRSIPAPAVQGEEEDVPAAPGRIVEDPVHHLYPFEIVFLVLRWADAKRLEDPGSGG